jgi:PAS domain S-box-containing protein
MASRATGNLAERIQELEERLGEAEETLRALRCGEVDAVVVSGPEGEQVYTLKSADQAYRVMVQNMAGGALTLTTDGLILFSNEQFARMLGIPLERVIGASIQNFVSPDDVPMLSALLAGLNGAKAELRLQGSRMSVPVQLSANRLFLDETECICVMVTDLTERKRNQEIVASERLARSILDQTAGALLVVDPRGRILRASSGAQQLANRNVLLRQFDDVFSLRKDPEETAYNFSEIISVVERLGSIAGVAATTRRPSGETLHVMLSASVLAGTRSECLGATVMMSDVSAIRRTEEALRESETRLRTLGDNLPEGAIYRYCQDIHGKPRFEFISAGIERLAGVPAAEVMDDAAALHRTVVPEDIERFKAALELSRERLTRLEMEVRLTHRVTGQLRWSLLQAMPSRRADGSTCWDGIQLDLTDRKLAEEELRVKEDQLRQAQKMESIGVLAGGIAHDFNNLLTGVIGNASLVHSSLPEWDPNRPLVEALMQSANRAADLTRQLLAYAGKGRVIARPVNVTTTVQEMMALLRGSVPPNIGILLNLQENIAPVESDEGQMQQIVMNLVLNAAEAVDDRPGQISITARTRRVDAAMVEQYRLEIPVGTYVCLEVKDTGAGMDLATKSRIFEPFFTTKFTGRGLGLAAVHGIVRSHNGAVLVDSEPGQGAHFTVLLPATGGMASEKPETGATEKDLGGEGTILVVDDEEAVRMVAASSLERFGYRVLMAANGIEAVEVFRKEAHQISLVLLDLTMPLLSGEETLQQLRSIRPDIPVLLSSGYNEIEAVKRFAGLPLAGFVGKPYSAKALVAKIKSIRDKPAMGAA